ncbi:MAG TPA: hypothetical protein VNA25_18120 [Phycisphaerae bacterium]|nr:hypothetical protein [Phycisphaerae bacterium]
MGTAARLILAAMVVAAVCSSASADANDLPYGEAVKGLRAALVLDRTRVCPGEPLEIEVYLRNASDGLLVMPHGEFRPNELRMRTPDGRVFGFAAAAGKLRPMAVMEHRARYTAKTRLRLTECLSEWRLLEGAGPNTLSLRRPGTYRLSFERVAEKGWDPNGRGWSGTVTSKVVELEVYELPPDKRLKEPTADERRLLDAATGRAIAKPPPLPFRALGDALLRTENEGLTLECVKRLREHADKPGRQIPRWWESLYRVVERRACEGDALGIDGPYLERLAKLSVDVIERHLPMPSRPVGDDAFYWPKLGPVLAYAKANPKDQAFRKRVVDLARKYAKVAERPSARLGGQGHLVNRQAHLQLHFAWGVLLGLDELREGMKLAEAVTILGEPTRREGGNVTWYYNSQMHVNPGLHAKVQGDTIVELK